jgi:hypothetical protein
MHLLVSFCITGTLNANAITHRCLAHQDAYKANILHRDISPGNIIIDSFGKGWLIDWDLSKPLTLSVETPRRATRTVSNDYLLLVMIKANPEYGPQGTWQFMSARLIGQQDGPHEFVDDLESSIYVLLWATLMYSEVSSPIQVPPFLASVLDPKCYKDTGGYAKQDFLRGRTFLERVTFYHRNTLHQLIDDLAGLFMYRYMAQPSNNQREQWNALVASSVASGDHLMKLASEDHICHKYDVAKAKLQSHTATIELFDDALNNGTWPDADASVMQVFEPDKSSGRFVKSNFNTNFLTPM